MYNHKVKTSPFYPFSNFLLLIIADFETRTTVCLQNGFSTSKRDIGGYFHKLKHLPANKGIFHKKGRASWQEK